MKKLLLALVLIPAFAQAATLAAPTVADPTTTAAAPIKYPRVVGTVTIAFEQYSAGSYSCIVSINPAPIAGAYPVPYSQLGICDNASMMIPGLGP